MSDQEPAVSRKDRVARILRQEVLWGTLKPGDPITDAAIAQRLRVSITPVREAITQLIEEGIIEALPNKRRRVMALSPAAAAELMDVYGVLVVALLRRASHRLTVDALAELRVLADSYRQLAVSRQSAEAYEVLQQFFGVLKTAASNSELTTLVDAVSTKSHRWVRLAHDSPLWDVWAKSLDEVVTRLETGRKNDAADRLEQHFAHVVAAMRQSKDAAGLVIRAGS